MEIHFDSYQFENRYQIKPVSQESHIAFSDYARMSMHRRKQVYDRRLRCPIWALDDRFLRKLLVLFLEARAGIHNPNLDLVTRRDIAERRLKERLPEWNARVDRLNHQYVDAQHKHASKERLQGLEIEIENLDTLIRMTQKSPLGFVAAIVVHYYRLGKNSVEVGEEIGCKPPHVRVILWRLHQLWNKTFGFEFNLEPAAPAVPACRSYTRKEIKEALATRKISIPAGDILPIKPGKYAPVLPGESRKARRARLMADGLCGNCGLKPRGKYAECVDCRAYYAALNRGYQQKKRAEAKAPAREDELVYA